VPVSKSAKLWSAGPVVAAALLASSAEALAQPPPQAPCTQEAHRQFDFWLGT
jgi:hypothetical protein